MSQLFAWPAAAAVNNRVPKDQLFRRAGGGKAIRALYDSQVERIDWVFKLFDRSVNLSPAGSVSEIEVFRIALRSDRLDDRVLAHIDKAIPHPILFELVRHAPDGEETQLVAAYKRRSDADAAKIVAHDHWAGEWRPAEGARAPLPTATNLEGLYGAILASLWPHPRRGDERLRDHAERLSKVATQAKMVERLRLILRREGDFARKTEINRELREAKRALNNLTE